MLFLTPKYEGAGEPQKGKTVIKRDNFITTTIYYFHFPFVWFLLVYAAEFHIHHDYKELSVGKVEAHLF